MFSYKRSIRWLFVLALSAIALLIFSTACGSPAVSTAPLTSTASSTLPASTAPLAPATSAAPTEVPAAISSKSSASSLLAVAADPIRVQAITDTDRTVEALIPLEGGTLSATAADGTQFTLDIPGDALLEKTLIRMTPVSRLEGMPFGSAAYAVQLEPEGLHFYNFATLTITPTAALPIDQQIPFGYEAAGDNFSLAAPVVNSREIKLQVLHFSGYGVSKGFLADIEPLRARIGGDAEARLQSAVAELLLQERTRQMLGIENGDPELDAKLQDLMRQYEEQVIKPRVAAAGESCAAGRLALQTVLGHERQKQLLGSGDDANTQLSGLMETVSNVCMKEEYEICRDDHVIHRIIPVWLGMERQSQLLGTTNDQGTNPLLENAKQYVSKCLNFELVFHSEATYDAGGNEGYQSIVDSKVKIQFDPKTTSLSASAPLVNTEYTVKPPKNCTAAAQRGGATFTVTSLSWDYSLPTPDKEYGVVKDILLHYAVPWTTESVTISCPKQPPFTFPPGWGWSSVFYVLHPAELDTTQGTDDSSSPGSAPMPTDIQLPGNGQLPGGLQLPTGVQLPGGMSLPNGVPQPGVGSLPGAGMPFLSSNWEIFGNEYFAKKEWIKDDGGTGTYEAGTFKLYHKPQ